MKASPLFSVASAIFVLLTVGCATSYPPVTPTARYYSVVDSIALPGADLGNKTYILSSAMKNVGDEDIQFKEFAHYVENALSLTGYKRVHGEDADIVIRFAYGIGEPETVINTNTYTVSAGYSYQVGWTWINVPPEKRTVRTETTTYERFLVVEAYDPKNKRSQLWRTTINSEGRNSDLRIALPHMIASAIYKFGTDTRGKQETVMYANAPRVLDIMRSFNTGGKNNLTGKARLGVAVEPLTRENMLIYQYVPAGILVVEVGENSVAKEMGLQVYDIILSVNDKIVKTPSTLVEEVANTEKGGEIRIVYFSWNTVREESKIVRLE